MAEGRTRQAGGANHPKQLQFEGIVSRNKSDRAECARNTREREKRKKHTLGLVQLQRLFMDTNIVFPFTNTVEREETIKGGSTCNTNADAYEKDGPKR